MLSISDKLVLFALLALTVNCSSPPAPPPEGYLELYGPYPGQKWLESTYVDEHGYTIPEPDVPLFTPKWTDAYNNGFFGDVDPYGYARVMLPSNYQDYDGQTLEYEAKKMIELRKQWCLR